MAEKTYVVKESTMRRILRMFEIVENSPAIVRDGGGKSDPQRILPYVIFRVKLSQSAGSNGSNVAAPTYTYHAYWPWDTTNGRKLNTASSGAAVSPEQSRPLGKVTAATIGLAYYDNTGAFKLYEAYERPGAVEACS